MFSVSESIGVAIIVVGTGESDHTSVVHMVDAIAGSYGSGSAVRAPAVTRVMGGGPEQIKIAKKIVGKYFWG